MYHPGMILKKTLVLLCGLCIWTAGCGDLFEVDQCFVAFGIRAVPARDLMTLAPGDSVALAAYREAGCSESWPVTWTVDPTGIVTARATGDSTAMLHAVAPGTAVVNVTNGNRSGFTLVGVTEP